MKTELKNVAAIIATAVWADGVYDESEKEAVVEIAEALELCPNEFSGEVENALKEIEEFDEKKLNKYLEEAATKVDGEDVEVIFEAVLEITLVDGVLSLSEVNNLLALAEYLGIDMGRAVLLLADMVKYDSELEIEMD